MKRILKRLKENEIEHKSVLKEKTNIALEHLQEMATVCKKTDGFGIIIEVYSEDHGILGDKRQPAHAHFKTANSEYLGKFAITQTPPRNIKYVFDCDKKKKIPPEYKEIVVKWGNSTNKEEKIKNWSILKLAWKILHP
jgi:hypothetical protein